MRLRRPTAALLLALAALAAGCGGDAEEKNAYVDDVQAAQRAFVNRFEQVLERLTPTSTLAQDRSTLGDFEQATGRLVTALKRVAVPEEVRDEHGRLVSAISAFRREIGSSQARLHSESAADRARVRTNLSSSVEGTQATIVTAIGDINAALRD